MRAFLLPALFGLSAFAERLLSRNFPHLICPLRYDSPNTPVVTQTSFELSTKVWTATSFDVPDNGATHCSLSFFINQDPELGAPWSLKGVRDDEPYLIAIAELPNDSFKNASITWNSHPWPKVNGAAGTLAVFKNGTTAFTWERQIACQKLQVAQFLLQPAQPVQQPDAALAWYELDYPHGLTYDMWVPF